MPIELKVPAVGESITEVQIAEWLKAEGDAVEKDEAVVVIDSEKATFEIPAPKSGTLSKILHPVGATVRVGEIIAHLEAGAAAPAAAKTKPAAARPAESKPSPSSSTRAARKQATSAEPESRPTPAPAPPEDVEAPAAAVAPTPAAEEPAASRTADPDEEIVPMSALRRTVARRLVEAKQQMAMLTTFNEVDMTAVQTLRREHQEAFEKRFEVKLGLMSFFVKATIDALKQFPQLNAEIRGNDIVYHNYFDIGVAIATGRGLVVPVLRRAERLGFADVEKAIGEFAQRAKDGKLKPGELAGGTFTITNGGVFGSLLSTPIINPPQTGILGLHTIQERPVAVKGEVVIRPMMYVALTYDHRLVDGREAVLFIRRIKEAIESPARLLLEV